MKSTKFLLALFFSIQTIVLFSQVQVVDSLESLIQNHINKTDTNYINLLNEAGKASVYVSLQKVFDYTTEAEKLADSLEYKPGLLAAYENFFLLYHYASMPDKSLSYVKQAYDLAEELDIDLSRARAFMNYGHYYKATNNYDSALWSIDQSTIYLERLGNEYGIAIGHNDKGIIYQKLQNYPKALESYFTSLVKAREIEDINLESDVLLNIGNVFTLQQDDSLALKYYKESLPLKEKSGNLVALSALNLNIGTSYNEIGEKDLARSHFIKALNLAKKTNEIENLFNSLVSLFALHIDMNRKEEAFKYIKEAEQIALNLENDSWIQFVYLYLVQYYLIEKDTLKAQKYVLAIEKDIEKNGHNNDASKLEALVNYYELKENYPKAHAYLVQYHKVYSNAINESNIKKITNLNNQYQFEKEKESITAKQAQKDVVQAADMKRQKQLRNLFSIAFFIILLLAIIILRSLTQKRKANKTLSQQKKEIEVINAKLVELDRFKETMTGMIVHDLKNPLNAIISQAKSTDVKYHANSMLSMVMNILDIQKFEDASMKIMPVKNLLFESINDAINQIMLPAQQKNIHIENTINSDLMILADRNLIDRVITNLLSNAIKYTPNNGKVVLIAKDEGDEYLKIMIEDNGTGIPKNKQIMIFDKFGQLDPKSLGISQSTGLGLTFCKMAVEAHGGNIGVESDGESGTVFWFTLKKTKNISTETKNSSEKKASSNYQFAIDKYGDKLNGTKFYEISKIRQILNSIDEDNDYITAWKKEITMASNAGNEELYLQFIGGKKNS